MNTVDKISRDLCTVSDSMGDMIVSRIIEARSSGAIDLNEKQLAEVVGLVGLTVKESYQKILPNFQKTISKYF